MDTKLKLYLSIGLLFAGATLTNHTTFQWDAYNIEFSDDEGFDVQDCDQILNTIFVEIFFNESNETPFSNIVAMMLEILTLKKDLVIELTEQEKHVKVINILEANKNCKDFSTWAKILIDPELKALLPQPVQDYIDSVPHFRKIKILVQKLRK